MLYFRLCTPKNVALHVLLSSRRHAERGFPRALPLASVYTRTELAGRYQAN